MNEIEFDEIFNKVVKVKRHKTIYKLCPFFIERIEKTSKLLDDKNNKKYGWKEISGSKFKMMYRDDENGRMMLKAECNLESDVMRIISILYEDEYYVDWVKKIKITFYRTQIVLHAN